MSTFIFNDKILTEHIVSKEAFCAAGENIQSDKQNYTYRQEKYLGLTRKNQIWTPKNRLFNQKTDHFRVLFFKKSDKQTKV